MELCNINVIIDHIVKNSRNVRREIQIFRLREGLIEAEILFAVTMSKRQVQCAQCVI